MAQQWSALHHRVLAMKVILTTVLDRWIPWNYAPVKRLSLSPLHSSCQILQNRSSESGEVGDVDSMGFLASQNLGWVEAMSRKKDCRPSSCCILDDKVAWTVKNSKLKCFKPGPSLSTVLFFANIQQSRSQSRRYCTRPWVTWVEGMYRW